MESNQRADTFAQHLEEVQWAERPMHPREERPTLGATIPSETWTITVLELQEAIRKLKTKRAAVQEPAEYLRALEAEGSIDENHWLLKYLQVCWETKKTPRAWHLAKVIPVYKKGPDWNNPVITT